MHSVSLGHKHSLFAASPSLPLSPLSWYSHMCNGINTLLRRGKGERTEKEEKEEGEAMEETGEVEERDE